MKGNIDISGFPGVGKTAATLQIIKRLEKLYTRKMNYGVINSLSLNRPENVYKNIWNIISME